MRALIVDDEPIARRILREQLESVPEVSVVGEAESGAEALACLAETAPDVLFLDLHMPDLDGLGVARALRRERLPLIVFVTAYDKHALEAFDWGAVDYLLKPVRQERLLASVEKARAQLAGMKPAAALVGASGAAGGASGAAGAGFGASGAVGVGAGGAVGAGMGTAPRRIVGRVGADQYLLDPADVIAFVAEGEVVRIVTGQQKYLASQTLKTIEEKLPTPPFRRIHRGTIINTDHIRKISPLSSKRWLLRLSNGMEAVVSKRLTTVIRHETRW